jgi:hypothetical protein
MIEGQIIKMDGGSLGPMSDGGSYSGGGFQGVPHSFSRSGRRPIFFIGIIFLIILGIILNFIFHLELWLIAVILVIVSVIGFITLAFLD